MPHPRECNHRLPRDRPHFKLVQRGAGFENHDVVAHGCLENLACVFQGLDDPLARSEDQFPLVEPHLVIAGELEFHVFVGESSERSSDSGKEGNQQCLHVESIVLIEPYPFQTGTDFLQHR